MDDQTRRKELKDFLRSRRNESRPESGDAARCRRRRVPGLRREELADRAEVSVTWYTWLEQGRAIQISRSALGRIAKVLRLSPADQSYFLALAGIEPCAAPALLSDFIVSEPLQAFLDGLTLVPALVLGPLFEVHAYNRLANQIFEFERFEGPHATNHLWRMFMDPTRHALYGDDWEEVALLTVGVFRVRYGQYSGNAKFDALLDSLMMKSTRFAALWARKHTTPLDTVEVNLRHSQYGVLKVSTVRFRLLPESDFVLATLPPADARTAKTFQKLAGHSLTAAVRRAGRTRLRNR